MTEKPISAPCDLRYGAYRSSGHRDPADIRWLVLHSTEVKQRSDRPITARNVASAETIARSFTRPTAHGSAHLVIDDTSCFRCLRNTQIPWAAPSANTKGFHIEQCAFAAWTHDEWMAHEDMLDRVAYKLAYHAWLFKIPLVFLTAQGLRANRRGVTTHAEVSKAFPNSQGNHTDPGSNYPMKYVLALAKRHLTAIERDAT